MLTAAHGTFPLSRGRCVGRPSVGLERIQARLAIDVAAVRNRQLALGNHIATDGTFPFLLEFCSHLRERGLDMGWDVRVIHLSVERVVVMDGDVMVGVLGLIILGPRKGDTLIGVDEFLLECGNGGGGHYGGD